MKILLLSSSYNSLTQRAHVELLEKGHDVSIELAICDESIREGIDLFQPDLILCPMLKYIIPKDIWLNTPCIIVHPGIKGDRGSASLDWALYDESPYWGVTAVQAADEVDSGAIWATGEFPLRKGTKSSVYRDDLSETAMKVMHLVVKRFNNDAFEPEPLIYSKPDVKGKFRPAMPQSVRGIDWNNDSSEQIMTKIRCSDSNPGVLDTINGNQYYLYGAHPEGALIGPPGEILAKRDGAICRATVDGAIWITHLKKRKDANGPYFKLPATLVLGSELDDIPDIPVNNIYSADIDTFREIWHHEENGVSYLHFDFYNGAMSTDQCRRLTQAFNEIRENSNSKVIVLMGGRDFWSNGIHLNVIEAAANPAEESWHNINAINDFVKAVMNCTDKYVISAIQGNAGAGGVIMALAADKVIVRDGVVLNPHYKSMGGLYGSEYWTYLLPKRVGNFMTDQLINNCLPVSAEKSKQIGLVDNVFYRDEHSASSFQDQIVRLAEKTAQQSELSQFLSDKHDRQMSDELQQRLASHREQELANMRTNFFGEDKSYHQARSAFVYKQNASETPLHLAKHRHILTEEFTRLKAVG